jgi:hypothetical protein
MLTTEKTKHPLERHGTTQRERLLKALMPENLQLDDSSIADLVAFAGEYAKQIRYWSPENRPDGDWTGFWEKDTTALMAIVAATDVDDIRVTYRNQELTFLRTCKKEKQDTGKSYCEDALKELHKLVGHIFNTALKIQSLCEKLPASHPIKGEVQSLIREKLGIGKDAKGNIDYEKPIGTLISYHKASYEILKDPKDTTELIDLYAPFIGETPCQQAWGLTEHDFLTCIDYKATVDENDREALWRLFLTFFKVLTLIVSKAEKAFNLALHGRRDHPPHISLFLAFIQLFRRYHLADMNALLAKHLVFYYRDVLRLQERKEIPDRVHIVFEIAQNIETYRLQKDTLLLGGKDSKGLDLLYGLADELVVNKAKLVEKQTLYFYSVLQPGTTNQFSKIPIRLPVADMKDGLKVPYTEGGKMWHPLSGEAIYKRLVSKRELFNRIDNGDLLQIVEKEIEPIVSKPGLILTSPELWLDKSEGRRIIIEFNEDSNIGSFINSLTFKISTDKGIVNIDSGFLKDPIKLEPNDFFIKATNLEIGIDGGNAYVRKAGNKNNKIEIFFTSDFPAIIAIKKDSKNALSELDNPFILIQLNKEVDYEEFRKTKINQCKINTSSRGLKNISIQLGNVTYPSSSEIPLIGSTVEQRTKLYVTAIELSAKTFDYSDNSTFKPILEGLSDTVKEDNKELITFGNDEYIKKPKIDFPGKIEGQAYSATSDLTFLRRNIKINNSSNINKPITIYKIQSESISIKYISDNVLLQFDDRNDINYPHKIYFYDFLDGYSWADNFSLVPQNTLPDFDNPIQLIIPQSRILPISSVPKPKTADGNLRLAFEDLKAGQSLSLLFHFADGTGNPDHIAPDEIVWSYLRKNKWVRISPQYILLDETLGLRQTGIVKIQIPSDINNGNTLAIGKDGRTDLFWLQASASEDQENNIYVDALPMLVDIYPQAGTAVFQNNKNDLAHIEKGLPAKTIAQLRYRDSNITKVAQPFISFDGRYSEVGDRNAYYRRISERLRHKQRAITVWDYERLTLEKFPKVAIAKCLPHTRDIDVERPQYVTMGIVPYPERMVGDRKYYPIFNAGFLETVEGYLNRHNSYFVSGWSGGVVCCCASENEADCTCSHDGYLVIRNAIFEPVRLQVCVKFRAGKDIFYYKKQLNEDLKNFLAPWATDTQTPLLFGATIYSVELLRFLENLDYIDVVMGLKFKHFPNREEAEKHENLIDFEENDIIEPFTSRSVLTTYLDILNEDNPNVIDHDIKIIEDQDCCADCTPKVDSLKKIGNNVKGIMLPFVVDRFDDRLYKTVKEKITAYLTEEWQAKILVGDTANDAFEVNIGIPETMTTADVSVGKLIVKLKLTLPDKIENLEAAVQKS